MDRKYSQYGRGKKWDTFKKGAKWAWSKIKDRAIGARKKQLPKLLPVLGAAPSERKGMLKGIGKEFLKDFVTHQQGSGYRRRAIRATW